MSVERLALVACGLFLGTAAPAEDSEEPEPEPDVAFLEYLGMWDETDEDWLVFDDERSAEMEKRNDPAPEGEESPEKTDES